MEGEREEERERQELKRRNYQLVVERAGLRRRGSNDSVEDQVRDVICLTWKHILETKLWW